MNIFESKKERDIRFNQETVQEVIYSYGMMLKMQSIIEMNSPNLVEYFKQYITKFKYSITVLIKGDQLNDGIDYAEIYKGHAKFIYDNEEKSKYWTFDNDDDYRFIDNACILVIEKCDEIIENRKVKNEKLIKDVKDKIIKEENGK